MTGIPRQSQTLLVAITDIYWNPELSVSIRLDTTDAHLKLKCLTLHSGALSEQASLHNLLWEIRIKLSGRVAAFRERVWTTAQIDTISKILHFDIRPSIEI
jgi:hypothetical protein